MIRIDALYFLLLCEAVVLLGVLAVFFYLRMKKARKAAVKVTEIQVADDSAAQNRVLEQDKQIAEMKKEIARLTAAVEAKESQVLSLQEQQARPQAAPASSQEELMSINIDMPPGEDLKSRVRELEKTIIEKDKELKAASRKFEDLEKEYLALYNEKMSLQ